MSRQQIQGCDLAGGSTNQPEFLMVPRKVNELSTRIAKAIQHRQKVHTRLQQTEVPEAVRAIFDSYERSPSNRTALGQVPDRVRLEADAVESFLAAVRPEGVIVEGLTADRVKEVRSLCRRNLIAALPPVFFEADIAPLRELLRMCQRNGVTVEVNSWGGWLLAKEAGVRMEGGPFLPVLNSLAARVLGTAGMQSVTLSVEADRRQLENLTDRCPVPCSLVVYGRPALMITRVALPDDFDGKWMVDRRETRSSRAANTACGCCGRPSRSTCGTNATTGSTFAIWSWTWSAPPTPPENGWKAAAIARPSASTTTARWREAGWEGLRSRVR